VEGLQELCRELFSLFDGENRSAEEGERAA